MPTIFTNLARGDLCRWFSKYSEYEYCRVHDVMELIAMLEWDTLEKGPKPKHDDVILIVDVCGLAPYTG